ncbi:ComF family protein [bacterium]|nr:ComF family protein [bacterium]
MKSRKDLPALKEILLDLIFPRSCCGCGTLLLGKERCVCLSCRLTLPYTQWHSLSPNKLEKMFYGRCEIEHATSFLYFMKDTAVQSLLHHLKYRSQKELGVLLGIWFGRALKTCDWANHVDAVLPVPLHPKKFKKRGYNQSALLAIGLAKGLETRTDFKSLKRIRFTETQTRKDRFSRQMNVKGAFLCKPMKHKSVIVIDDVSTTGATLESSVEAIKKNNPDCKINICTLATAV